MLTAKCYLCSWLSKMQVAKQVLVDDAGKFPDADALANAFIYLQAGLSCFLKYVSRFIPDFVMALQSKRGC